MTTEATNCHRAYAAKDADASLNFESEVIDFKDSPMGSVHIFWRGLSGSLVNSSFQLFASNLPDVQSFDPDGTEIDGSEIEPHAADGSRIWIRDRLGFRYLMVRWTAGDVVDGEIDIIAIGKKS